MAGVEAIGGLGVGEREGLATINREWGRRMIRVQVNVTGRDVASYVDEARGRGRFQA